jgi:hypothetical protein
MTGQRYAMGVPWGHSISAHNLLGWCSACPGRDAEQEMAAWRGWALPRLYVLLEGEGRGQ